MKPNSPLLDFVESLQLGDGDEDDDGLLSTSDIDLLRGGDLREQIRSRLKSEPSLINSRNTIATMRKWLYLERAELSLELGDAIFEVDQSLSYFKLD